MRTVSKERAALKRKTDKPRTDYVKESQMCQVCGCCFAVQCHEICRGSSRAEALKHRALWLAVCVECHDDLGDYREWPISRQCAQKLLADPLHFDLQLVNRVRGRADNAIDLSDITRHLKLV
jgi:hypothetical protein